MLTLLIGMMMSMVLSLVIGVYLYQDGIRCVFEKDDLKCAKDTTCHWVTTLDGTDGKCVPRRYYQLSGDEKIRANTSCAIIDTETNCLDHIDDDCVWSDGECDFHACYVHDDVGDCNSDDACSWNSEQLKCRKKVPE